MGRSVEIIGAPTDFGSNRRGVDMGPSAIRYAGLEHYLASAGIDTVDAGDLVVHHMNRTARKNRVSDDHVAQFQETIDVCTALADRVEASLAKGRLPLVLGGDHSIAIGTIRGSTATEELGVLWFDAHGDFNTPSTSPSGNIHGMTLAALLGIGEFADTDWANAPNLREENVVVVGLRDVDDGEAEALRSSDVTVFTMSDIDKYGITSVVEDALECVTIGVPGIHVSLDMDFLDPNEAPGVGTPVRGGVTYREAHLAFELLAEWDATDELLRSLEVVEVNPIVDHHNETAELATELAASALGKRIL